jgi:hypothetical protein
MVLSDVVMKQLKLLIKDQKMDLETATIISYLYLEILSIYKFDPVLKKVILFLNFTIKKQLISIIIKKSEIKHLKAQLFLNHFQVFLSLQYPAKILLTHLCLLLRLQHFHTVLQALFYQPTMDLYIFQEPKKRLL